MSIILHNLSFQLLFPHLDVLLQKNFQKDKFCSWKIFTDYSKWLPVSLLLIIRGITSNNISPKIYKFSYDRNLQEREWTFTSHYEWYFQVKRNFLQYSYIFQTGNLHSLKYGLDAVPCGASQLWQQVLIDIHEAASLALFQSRIRTWKCEDSPCRSFKIFIQNVGFIWSGSISNWW